MVLAQNINLSELSLNPGSHKNLVVQCLFECTLVLGNHMNESAIEDLH